MPTSFERLRKHSLVRKVLAATQPVVSADLSSLRGKRGEELAKAQARNRAKVSQRQRYDFDVMYPLLSLFSAVSRVETAARLIPIYPSQFARTGTRLLRSDWVKYHLGYFTVSLASLVDVALRLTAGVYQLGLAQRWCTMEVVTSHEQVRQSVTAKALRSLDGALQRFKERRNRHLHWGEDADPGELTDPEFFSNLVMITFVHAVSPIKRVDAEWLREAWQAALGELRPILVKAQQEAASALARVLTALEPRYEMTTRALDVLTGPRPGGTT